MGALKNRNPFSTTLRKNLYEKFDELVAESRINKSKLTDEAIEDLLKKYGKSVEK